MQLILLERVAKLGQMGEVVKVRDGYARNFLLPQGKALRATPENMKRFDDQRAQLETRNLEQRKEAETVAEKMEGLTVIVVRQAAETGQLYGSVSTRDLAETLSGEGFSVARGQIELHQPIKAVGIHTVVVSLHPEVEVPITVNVARSVDEAERQARGEDLTRRDQGFVFEEEEEADELADEAGAQAEAGGETGAEGQ